MGLSVPTTIVFRDFDHPGGAGYHQHLRADSVHHRARILDRRGSLRDPGVWKYFQRILDSKP